MLHYCIPTFESPCIQYIYKSFKANYKYLKLLKRKRILRLIIYLIIIARLQSDKALCDVTIQSYNKVINTIRNKLNINRYYHCFIKYTRQNYVINAGKTLQWQTLTAAFNLNKRVTKRKLKLVTTIQQYNTKPSHRWHISVSLDAGPKPG